jgi:hypothetical protein
MPNLPRRHREYGLGDIIERPAVLFSLNWSAARLAGDFLKAMNTSTLDGWLMNFTDMFPRAPPAAAATTIVWLGAPEMAGWVIVTEASPARAGG